MVLVMEGSHAISIVISTMYRSLKLVAVHIQGHSTTVHVDIGFNHQYALKTDDIGPYHQTDDVTEYGFKQMISPKRGSTIWRM